ncbi:hypothetical protein OG21DRAFT_272929 [Imleria badia]|nr:hypothetical protein OG21DRAFT_272929 [Imleria badia]
MVPRKTRGKGWFVVVPLSAAPIRSSATTYSVDQQGIPFRRDFLQDSDTRISHQTVRPVVSGPRAIGNICVIVRVGQPCLAQEKMATAGDSQRGS